MPLFRISVLALLLLLLPLSLSCDINRSPADVGSDYNTVVETQLSATIAVLLQNTSCKDVKLRHKIPTCRSNITVFQDGPTSVLQNILSTLHNLTCKMKSLGVHHTAQVTGSILNSLRCPCPSRPTKGPRANSRRTTRRRRSEHTQSLCVTRKSCRALAMIDEITNCYQILNIQLVTK